MKELWKKPKLIASFIENTDINVLREHLAPFFAHNFYENILSYDCIEDNLIYILTLLMQSEIKNLNDINKKDKFLIDTPCGVMFEEIYKKVEIQMYLNKITKNAIENLEKNYSTHKLDFNLKNISIELDWSISNEINDDKNKKEEFNKKYIPILDKSSMEKLLEENKNNKNMYDFLNSKLSLFSNNGNQKFSNNNFLSYCKSQKNSDKLLKLYINKFNIAIDFIDQLIKDILKEIHSIPDSLKIICRIISELITQKFPNINTVDRNTFISKFFFNKLIIPFLSNRNIFTYISDNSFNNLKILASILKKCINGDFFNSDESEFSFTPFNWYTIYNIENIINLYQNITNVKLAPYLENLINNKLPPDFEYDYFNENPEKKFNIQSILYNIHQIKALLTTIDNNKNIIPKDNQYIMIEKAIQIILKKNIINKLESFINGEKDNVNNIENINRNNQSKNNKKEKKKEENEIPKSKIKYFLIFQLLVNKKYNRYLETRSRDHFYIKQNKESKEENDISKFKNYLINLLNDYKQLEKNEFNENEINSIEKMINKIYYSLSYLEIDDDFSKLSADYILEYLQKLPEDSRENYLIKICDELEKEINESIKEINFDILAIINRIIKFNKRYLINDKKYFEILEDYRLNEEIKKIAKEYFIPIDIIFEYKNDIISKFDIKESSFKEKEKEKEDKIKKYEKSNKVKLCLNIENFIKIFPDFNKYQFNDDNEKDIFDIQQNIGVPNALNKYKYIIKAKLKINNITNLEEISNKIYDYIIEKIYDKCYPNKPLKKDLEIYKKCISLNWIQPYHFIEKRDLVFFGNSEKEFADNIKLFIQEKSINNKIIIINKISKLINLLYKFDTMSKYPRVDIDRICQILNYTIIKSEPEMLYSSIRFFDLYNKELIILETWKAICEGIPRITYRNFENISSEDFENKCNEAFKKNK